MPKTRTQSTEDCDEDAIVTDFPAVIAPSTHNQHMVGNGATEADAGHVNYSFVHDEEEPPASETAPREHPVYYTTQDGVTVVQERVVMTRPDGSKVIMMPDRQHWKVERPVKERDLKLLQIFSVISIVLFLPTGIAALVYARRTVKAYYEGLQRNDMEDARKAAKMTERLIIMSFVCFILIGGLIIALLVTGRKDKSEEMNRLGQ